MAAISLKKKDLPFLLGGNGEISVETGNLKLNQPLSADAGSLLSVKFKASGSEKLSLGQDASVKIGVSAESNVQLIPVFAASTGAGPKLLKTNGLGDFFKKGANPDKAVLVFDVGASADVATTGTFAYSVLKASVELDAGADAGYTYARALDKSLPIKRLVPDFFKTMRLPDQGELAPEPGEAISLRYGGYLRLGAEASAGYRLSGTKSVSIGQLALSEKYDLSVIGRIVLSAGVAGRFSILVTAADPALTQTAAGTERDAARWARVQVRRHRAKDLKIAADVNVNVNNQLEPLPATPMEFLGAALGVNGKSFLNVLTKARDAADKSTLEGSIDGLAKKFIEELVGKGFDKLGSVTEFTKFIGTVNRVVTSYEQLEDRAITLFDRYLDKLDDLTAFLDRIEGLQPGGLSTLRKDLSPTLWNILAQLTDGDPLGFLVEQVTLPGAKERIDSLTELRKRARAVLALIRDPEHQDIRRVLTLAKQSFGVDKLFRELAKVDTVDELEALANEKVGLFVTRLVGRTLDSSTNLKQALNEVRAVLGKIDDFAQKLFKSFKDAVNSSYKVALHAEYSRASEFDALIDVLINMSGPQGRALLDKAGKGDFEEILTTSNTDIVRLLEGVLTHRTRRNKAFNVNIVGWHLNYRYEGFDRVITETEQRLMPSADGITIITSASLAVERQRKRQDELVHVNFLLRALGESAKVVRSDARQLGYLIETLSSLTARYRLEFTDDDTSLVELRDYLGFAQDLGLDKQGATLEQLEPLLPRGSNGSFGKLEASYDVRFGKRALDAILSVKTVSKEGEQAIRSVLRRMLLSNYVKSEALHDVAFSYATPAIFDVFMDEGFASFGNHSQRDFPIRLENRSIAAPSRVVLDRTELNVLITLYSIENSIVDAIKSLIALLNGKTIDPAAFEKKLGKFGDAMNAFDNFDQTSNEHGVGTNTVFAVFDELVRLASRGEPANTSVLRLKSEAAGKTVEKLFLTPEPASVAN
jgi:hypothetical protein